MVKFAIYTYLTEDATPIKYNNKESVNKSRFRKAVDMWFKIKAHLLRKLYLSNNMKISDTKHNRAYRFDMILKVI
jgi:hypothetical protein